MHIESQNWMMQGLLLLCCVIVTASNLQDLLWSLNSLFIYFYLALEPFHQQSRLQFSSLTLVLIVERELSPKYPICLLFWVDYSLHKSTANRMMVFLLRHPWHKVGLRRTDIPSFPVGVYCDTMPVRAEKKANWMSYLLHGLFVLSIIIYFTLTTTHAPKTFPYTTSKKVFTLI